MKVGLHTVDLFPGRERLMPFRTILEVAQIMRSKGWTVDVLNSSVSEKKTQDFEWMGIQVIQCPRDFKDLSKWVNQHDYDVFYFAATIREGLKNLNGLKYMSCRKVAYVPSGITPLKNALWLAQLYGSYAKAWMLEAITPKKLVAKKLRRVGFSDIIGLTEFTTQMLGTSLTGHTIYPGKDVFEELQSDDSIMKRNHLSDEKFYLFTGGPAPSRGGEVLLRSFDQMASQIHDARLVWLTRKDVGGEYQQLLTTLDGLKHKNRVNVIREKLSMAQLKAFFEAAYAVVLPFICIPAEVPLTYYEVLSCGTPIISFPNAGTTDYLKDGLMLTDGIGINALTQTMANLWNLPEKRKILSENAKIIMRNHPTWVKVGEAWMDIVKKHD